MNLLLPSPSLYPQNEIVSAMIESILTGRPYTKYLFIVVCSSGFFHVPRSDVSHRLVIVLVRLNDHFTFPRTFTYLLKHPLTLIHAAGIPVIAYLDDLCLWWDSPQDVPASVEKFPVSWRS